MHVLILNQTFWPDTAATAQHMWDLAQHLDAAGHRITVITSRYRYGTDQVVGPPREQVGGIEVRRLGGTGWGKRSILTRLADQLSFYAAAAMELPRVEAPDVIIALTSPPMISTLVALQRPFRRTREGRPVKFVYYMMDLYPDTAVAAGPAWGARDMDRLFGRLTRAALEAADAIIVLGRDMQERVIRRYGDHLLARKMHLVHPWADSRELAPMPKGESQLARDQGLIDPFTVMYAGNLGVAHDTSTLLAGIELLRDEAGIRWLFVGSGRKYGEVQSRAASMGWTNVTFLPPQPRETLNDTLNAADVHLVTQLPAFTGTVVPSKLFGILAVGKPTIMIGPAEAEVSRILNQTGAGLVVPTGDAAGLVQAVRQLRDDPELGQRMGQAARKALAGQYDRAIACERIERILTDVIDG